MTVLGQHERAGEFVCQVLAFGDALRPDVAAMLRVSDIMLNQIATGLMPVDDIEELTRECVRTGATERYPLLAIGLPMLAIMNRKRELALEQARRGQAAADPWMRASGHWVESFVLLDAGDLAGAEAARNRALAGFEAIGDRWGLAMTLTFKAVSRSESGDAEAAIELHQQGLRLAMELRAQDDVVGHWSRLASERARAGDLAGAWREIEAAERYAQGIGIPRATFIVLVGRMEVQLRENDVAGVRQTVAESRRFAAQTQFRGGFEEEWLCAYEARAALVEGRPDVAEPLVQTTMRLAGRRGDVPDVAGAAELLARIRWQQGRPEPAARLLGLVALIRGRLDLGNPDVRRLIDDLRAALPDRYDELFEAAHSLSKEDGLAAAYAEAGIDDPRGESP
jgi:hypothetical protein